MSQCVLTANFGGVFAYAGQTSAPHQWGVVQLHENQHKEEASSVPPHHGGVVPAPWETTQRGVFLCAAWLPKRRQPGNLSPA